MILEVDAAQFPAAALAVHRAITIARVEADLSGAQADTLAALMLALIEGGSPSFTVTIEE